MDKEVWNMTPLEKAAHWDRCYPGNLNIEMLVNELASEIELLTAELAETRSALTTARRDAANEAFEKAAKKSDPFPMFYEANDTPSDIEKQAYDIRYNLAYAIRALRDTIT